MVSIRFHTSSGLQGWYVGNLNKLRHWEPDQCVSKSTYLRALYICGTKHKSATVTSLPTQNRPAVCVSVCSRAAKSQTINYSPCSSLVLYMYPICLRPYHFLKLASFLGVNRTKSTSVCPWLLYKFLEYNTMQCINHCSFFFSISVC